jgi:VanZ family protein
MKLLFWNKFNFLPRFHTWLLLSYCLLILFLSLGSFNSVITLNKSKLIGFRADYLAHVLLFIPWMPLASFCRREKTGRRIFMAAFAAGVVLAILSEGMQLLVPNRMS